MTSTENTAAPASPASGDGEGSGDPLPAGLKLVYTGSVTIDSTDYDATVADVRKLIADYGCLVEQANESDYDRTWRDAASSVREHTWTLRVPSEKFSALLDSFGTVPLCSDALFNCDALPELNVAVDLGNDIQSIWTDTTRHARAGAQIVCLPEMFACQYEPSVPTSFQ